MRDEFITLSEFITLMYGIELEEGDPFPQHGSGIGGGDDAGSPLKNPTTTGTRTRSRTTKGTRPTTKRSSIAAWSFEKD